VSRPFDVAAARARCEAAAVARASITGLIAEYGRWCATAGRDPGKGWHADVAADRVSAALAAMNLSADLPAALDEIEALREALADARTSALEEAAGIADGYCGDGVALDQWTPHGDGERTREDIARDIRAAIGAAPRVDRISAILAMLDAEDSDLGRHLAEKARALGGGS
jgi:hypothetical protein